VPLTGGGDAKLPVPLPKLFGLLLPKLLPPLFRPLLPVDGNGCWGGVMFELLRPLDCPPKLFDPTLFDPKPFDGVVVPALELLNGLVLGEKPGLVFVAELKPPGPVPVENPLPDLKVFALPVELFGRLALP
jgi:hypothetical protein